MYQWFCIRTVPKQEALARQNLQQMGFRTFFPAFLHKKKDRQIVVKQLFASYGFVSSDDPRLWPSIKNAIGVVDILTYMPDGSDYRQASSLPSEEIERLRQLALSYDEVQRGGVGRIMVLPQQIITAGCCVRIKSGPFADLAIEQKPIVEWADHERAALILSMFGRRLRVEFYHRDLERVDA